MAALGVVLLARSRLRRLGRLKPARAAPLAGRADVAASALQRAAFAGILVLCLTIPSNWTQNIPARYGARHPNLVHSWLYRDLDWTPPAASPLAAPR
jgi:hypothetical protein